MPIEYQCDQTRRVTYEVWHGYTSGKDWETLVAQQNADPKWPAGERYISDLRSAVFTAEELGAIQEKTKEYKKLPGNFQIAILAPTGQFESVELFEAGMTHLGYRCMVFTTVETACEWLGIDVQETVALLSAIRRSLQSRDSSHVRGSQPDESPADSASTS